MVTTPVPALRSIRAPTGERGVRSTSGIDLPDSCSHQVPIRELSLDRNCGGWPAAAAAAATGSGRLTKTVTAAARARTATRAAAAAPAATRLLGPRRPAAGAA